MNLDLLPNEMLLKILEKASPKTNLKTKFMNQRIHSLVDKYSLDCIKCREITIYSDRVRIITHFDDTKEEQQLKKEGDYFLRVLTNTVVMKRFDISELTIKKHAKSLKHVVLDECFNEYNLTEMVFKDLVKNDNIESISYTCCNWPVTDCLLNPYFASIAVLHDIENKGYGPEMVWKFANGRLRQIVISPSQTFLYPHIRTNFRLKDVFLYMKRSVKRKLKVKWDFGTITNGTNEELYKFKRTTSIRIHEVTGNKVIHRIQKGGIRFNTEFITEE